MFLPLSSSLSVDLLTLLLPPALLTNQRPPLLLPAPNLIQHLFTIPQRLSPALWQLPTVFYGGLCEIVCGLLEIVDALVELLVKGRDWEGSECE